MNWAHGVAYFFGAVFLANAVPHLVSGLMGRPFQSPFARPPGEGFSSSTVNAIWGWSNLAVGYLLVFQVGTFDVHDLAHVGPGLVGVLLFSVLMAGRFGRFNGGNHPQVAQAALQKDR